MRRGLLQIELLLFAAGAAGVVNAQTTAQKLLWHDPGDVSKIDLGGSVGTGIGAPKPPFTFVKEDMSGTQPKVEVIDGTGRKWVGKFGNEVKPECFTWRIPVAAGYYVEPSYYIASGQFVNIGAMQRKTPSIQGRALQRRPVPDPRSQFQISRQSVLEMARAILSRAPGN